MRWKLEVKISKCLLNLGEGARSRNRSDCGNWLVCVKYSMRGHGVGPYHRSRRAPERSLALPLSENAELRIV
jgi:hypothetical protein